jgi:2-polyprenyl-3-methyl-5-hydroxy-6-metoxy-1,4-benzoquinol methylase
MSLIHYQACPSCRSAEITPALSAVDHTVSNKAFEIWQCRGCGLRFTQDVPDADSIGSYYKSESYISHTDTRKGLVNRLYLLIRRQTLGDKRRLIQSAVRLKQGRLLDIGAGTGAFAAYMRDHGWITIGLEPDEAARQRAFEVNRIDLMPMDQLPFLPKEQFDAITLWHVLEHVHGLHAYLDLLAPLIKRDGRLFIAVPNYTSYDAEVYQGNWAAYDTPRHLYHFSPDSMRALLASHNLRLQASRPMWYDSFYISMLSEQYRGNGKGNIMKAVLTGLVSNAKAFVNKSKCSSLIYIVSK